MANADMPHRRLLIGFGGHPLVEANHFRRQRLIEAQCRRTGKGEAEAAAALLTMDPSSLALLELTGSPDTAGVHTFDYDPTTER